jgi:hypothetical protein
LLIAAKLVTTQLLVRADSGFCSLKLMQEIMAQAFEIIPNSGKIIFKQRKIMRNDWQAVSAMLMERLSR